MSKGDSEASTDVQLTNFYLAARSETASKYYDGQNQFYINIKIHEKTITYHIYYCYNGVSTPIAEEGWIAHPEGELSYEFGVVTLSGVPNVIFKVSGTTIDKKIAVSDENAADDKITGSKFRIVGSYTDTIKINGVNASVFLGNNYTATTVI